MQAKVYEEKEKEKRHAGFLVWWEEHRSLTRTTFKTLGIKTLGLYINTQRFSIGAEINVMFKSHHTSQLRKAFKESEAVSKSHIAL